MVKKKKGFTRILGLDLALNSTGFSVIDVNYKTSELVIRSIGTTNTEKKKDWGEKYKIIYDQMCFMRKDVDPDVLLIERPFLLHEISTRAVLGALGIVRFAFMGFDEPIFISANQIKKEIAGHGHAKKYMVEQALNREYPDARFANDDEADSFALIITHLKKEGIL